jgi:regulator of sigma E protease
VVPLEPPRIGLVDPGLPAGRAGLRPGDLILRANGDTIVSWNALLRVVWHSPDRQISLDALRGDSVVHVTLTPKRLVETDSTSPRPKVYGQIGAAVDYPIVHVPQTVPRSALLGVRETLAAAGQVVGTLKGLLLGQLSVREVGGPILIAQISGQVARLGFEQLLRFMAFFSVNLALLNLLPVPLLDGGQVVFVLAEAVRRKPLSLNTRLRLQQVGFVLLLCLMALAIGNDVVRTLFH